MAQHKASTRAVLRSKLKHKKAADKLLAAMNDLTAKIAAARAKVSADANGTWDIDYMSVAGMAFVDFDAKNIGQNKASLRKILIDSLAHKSLGNELCNILEEAQVALNLVLAQMDADAGTLSADGVYEVFRVSELDIDAPHFGQHHASFRKVMQSALAHKSLGSSLSEQIAAIQSELNAMIDDIQAAN